MYQKTAWQAFTVLIMLAISAATCAKNNQDPKQGKTPQSRNPVLDRNFADPTVIEHNGTYYAYATNANQCNIQLASSTDLVNWKVEADAMPDKPSWATHDFWAPHVLYDPDLKKFVMFYSGESTDSLTGKCLGVAFADKATGPFRDMGAPLICGEGFVNIDPMAMIDSISGKKLLYWGSGFAPIKVQEMDHSWKKFAPGTIAKPLLFPGKEKNYTNLLEGAWVDYYNGFYYIYYSGDNCCGPEANYAVLVARSDSAMGPFTTMAIAKNSQSSVVLQRNAQWLAPGHNSIIRNSSGQAFVAFHAIELNNGNWKYNRETRAFCISPLHYKNGWPEIEF